MSTSKEKSSRRKSAQARRAEILTAAMEVFGRKGYNAATMDEIATECGVSKGTMYNYFASKEALFLALFQQQVTQEKPLAEVAASDMTGEQKMEWFVESWFKRFDERHYFGVLILEFILAAMHQSQGEGTFMKFFTEFEEERDKALEAICKQWDAESNCPHALSPRDGAMMIRSLLIGLMVQRMLGFENRPSQEYKDAINRAFFDDHGCKACSSSTEQDA